MSESAAQASPAQEPPQEPAQEPAPRPDDIAVVGAGCRFPGGIRDLDGLWRVLLDRVDLVQKVPADRWDDSYHDEDPKAPGATYCDQGSFLSDIDRFDAGFFNLSPREAREMDPQQRMLLEVAWEAMEDSGRPRAHWEGTRTSVHVGILGSDYLLLHSKTRGTEEIDQYFASGKEFSFGAGRLAYTFGLHGPCMTVSTACSSSLVAVHLACQALRNGEADTALAGGVNAIVAPELTVFMGKVQALSPTGRCKPFDARADGIVRGEGCGVIVLKRYADAQRDGDRIHGVIRGSAVNQDGRSAGLTVPNAVAQQALLRRALDVAGVAPDVPAYVEAHGTGTPLGDPLELSALADVLGKGRASDRPLVVGSHKANFGHMDSAAGIAGLMKTLLVAKHGVAPPQLHYTYPTPLIDWDSTGLVIPTAATPLTPVAGPLVAGVSAFGLSGTNAHIVLSAPEPEAAPADAAETTPQTLVISASTADGLRELAGDYINLLHSTPAEETAAVTAAAAVHRTHLTHRLAVTGDHAGDLTAGLENFRRGVEHPGVAAGEAGERPVPVVHVFSGQGSQYPGMGMELYETEPVYRAVVDACDELVREHGGWSLTEALRSPDPAVLRATEVAQPAVFAVQVALARLWSSWGVEPDAVIGHSMGEVSAACVAGALTLPDATRLIVARGKLMQQASGHGRMVMVALSAEETAERLGDRHPEVTVATVNGPASIVVAGPPQAVDAAVSELQRSGASAIPLPVDYAFHSPGMKPYGDELERQFADLAVGEPRIPFHSTAVPATDDDPATPSLDAAYWGANVRDPVLFWPAVDRLLAKGNYAFVELGAHPVLGRPLQSSLGHRERTGPVVSSLARGRGARTALAQARARLHTAGVAVDWKAAAAGPVRPRSLPPHRWADERYWLQGVPRGVQSTGRIDLEGLRAEIRLFDSQDRLVGEVEGSPQSRAGAGTSPRVPSPPAAAARAEGSSAAAALPPKAPQSTAGPSKPGQSKAGQSKAGQSKPGHSKSAPSGREQIAAVVQRSLAVILGHSPDKRLPRTRGFFELGIDSVSVTEFARRVSDELGVAVDAAEALAHASIDSLTDHIHSRTPRPAPISPATPAEAAVPPPAQAGGGTTGPEPIAIVGMGCRLPGGVTDPDGYWRLLTEGRDASGDIPAARWDAAAMHADGEVTPGKVVTKRGSFLDGADGFDNSFFRISPREAVSMDPQQRVLLEVAWEALDDAGLPADGLRELRTGVFVGLNTTDYQQLVTRNAAGIDLYYGTGNSFSGAAGRLSYFLGTRGPSIAVDTACSSSLTAVHLACQSLRSGESEVAVAGGVNVMATPTVFLAMSAAGALSPDGRCKTFDDSADGYGRGEGAGVVVLKPLSRALRDGDRVYAVIRGSAVNQDGASGGLTVPSGEAQQEVIAAALRQARIDAEDVHYVEAHGTGTRLGDAIELQALAGALRNGRETADPLLVGSVKTNVGHLEAAAGVTGLMKVVLSLRNEELPRHLHVRQPTRQIAWDRLPVKVTSEPVPWPRGRRPRIAGVSAFGFTGTNAHVLLAEAPDAALTDQPPTDRPGQASAPGGVGARPYALAASAATPAALADAAARLAERIRTAEESELPGLCWTSGARRTHHEHRLVAVGTCRQELVDALAAAGRAEAGRGTLLGTARPGELRRLALVYGGTAPELPWAALLDPSASGHEESVCALFAGDRDGAEAFRTAVTGADAAIRRALRYSPVKSWRTGERPAAGSPQEHALVFTAQLGMTALWAALGVTPDAVVGHGLGELAAACVAGELALSDAAERIAAGQQSPPAEEGSLKRYTATGWQELAGELVADGVEAVLDAGTGSSAAQLLRAALEARGADDVLVLSTPLERGSGGVRHPVAGATELVELAAALHAHGCHVDWDRLATGPRTPASLPGYPWQHRSYWIGTPDDLAAAPAAETAEETDASASLDAELRALTPPQRREHLLETVLDLVSDVLGGVDDVAPDQGFFDLGMDSVLSQELKKRSERLLGCELPGTVMFECPNAQSFADFIATEVYGDGGQEEEPVSPPLGSELPGSELHGAQEPQDDLAELTDEGLMSRLAAALTSSADMLSEEE